MSRVVIYILNLDVFLKEIEKNFHRKVSVKFFQKPYVYFCPYLL